MGLTRKGVRIMSGKDLKARSWLALLLAAPAFLLTSIPAPASSAAIGSVTATTNATLNGQPLLPKSAVFSGDMLSVKNGAVEIVLSDGSRLVFGQDTEASFLGEVNVVTAVLGHGTVVLFHPTGSAGLQLKVSDFLIVPAEEFKTQGQVAMLNGEVVVTSRDGSLRIEGNGPPMEVPSGKTVTIPLNTGPGPLNARPASQGAAGGAGPARGGSSRLMSVTTLGLGAVGTAVSLAGLSRGSSATDAANRAIALANASEASAAAASRAALAAVNAATAATNLAIAEGLVSLGEVNVVGCELDALASAEGKASPYKPPAGFKCP
jgi:hypothetical protein